MEFCAPLTHTSMKCALMRVPRAYFARTRIARLVRPLTAPILSTPLAEVLFDFVVYTVWFGVSVACTCTCVYVCVCAFLVERLKKCA